MGQQLGDIIMCPHAFHIWCPPALIWPCNAEAAVMMISLRTVKEDRDDYRATFSVNNTVITISRRQRGQTTTFTLLTGTPWPPRPITATTTTITITITHRRIPLNIPLISRSYCIPSLPNLHHAQCTPHSSSGR